MLLCVATACSEDAVSLSMRSLERSDSVAFACVAFSDPENPARAMQDCGSVRADGTSSAGSLYAFVTQVIRGEVAIIDLTSDRVVDLSPSKPGFNFIPVGAQPTGIAATQGGTAIFVGSAEVGRESIWILPSKTIAKLDPSLTSFAACALPSAPGQHIKVVVEPTSPSDTPSRCGGQAYEHADHPNGDLALEQDMLGVTPGTPKLVVTLPDVGAVVVMDAQEMIDREPGSFRPCLIERWISLRVDLPMSLPQQRVPEGGFAPGFDADGNVCAMTEQPETQTLSSFSPRPAGVVYDADESKLYVADEDAPVIHVLDASSPCEMNELAPLLPMSATRPDRIVYSRAVAVSPRTSNGSKYLYATDLYDGSVMVFDVSLQSADRTPLIHPHRYRVPFLSPDRIAFSVPVRDVEIVLRDSPVADPNSGVTAVGIACDPSDDNSVGAQYRTSSSFASGARPYGLRGVFAVLALTNGQIAIIDIDDFDASCRRPKELGACENETLASYHGASGELSCDTVRPHQARSASFLLTADGANGSVPGLRSYPNLFLGTTTLSVSQSPEGHKHPKLLAPDVSDYELAGVAVPLIGGRSVSKMETDPSTAENNGVVFDVRDPRVHVAQDWAVVFEGTIPGFEGHVGRFAPSADAQGRAKFTDSGAFFCDRGVHDLDAAKAVGSSIGINDSSENAWWAMDHRDALQVTSDFLDAKDSYWKSVEGQCSWMQCRETFGVVLDPKTTRDFSIAEAYQGSLIVEAGDLYEFMRCCFPSLVSYTVRPRNQWVVTGSSSGFLHRVTPDIQTGRCVDSCDPNKMLLNGRVIERETDKEVPKFDGHGTFRNPHMQFVVWQGGQSSVRDMYFSFRQDHGFKPLMISLGGSTRYVQPLSIVLAPTGELALADGSAQGLVLVDLRTFGVSRSFY